jgi:hypothetical protein
MSSHLHFMKSISVSRSQPQCVTRTTSRSSLHEEHKYKYVGVVISRLSKGILFLQDNAGPHKATITHQKLWDLHIEVLKHPAYSPDLAPLDHYPVYKVKDLSAPPRITQDWKRCTPYCSTQNAQQNYTFLRLQERRVSLRWIRKITVFWNVTPCVLLEIYYVSEEPALSICSIEES